MLGEIEQFLNLELHLTNSKLNKIKDHISSSYELVDNGRSLYFVKIYKNNISLKTINTIKILCKEMPGLTIEIDDLINNPLFYGCYLIVIFKWYDVKKITLNKKNIKASGNLIKRFHNSGIQLSEEKGLANWEESKLWDTNKIKAILPYLGHEGEIILNIKKPLIPMIDRAETNRGLIHGDFKVDNILAVRDKLLLSDLDTVGYGALSIDSGRFCMNLYEKNQIELIKVFWETYTNQIFNKNVCVEAMAVSQWYKILWYITMDDSTNSQKILRLKKHVNNLYRLLSNLNYRW